ncbi:hypothetical protein BX666DRAFT_2131660 [Dichotomocladium elegans]|nr:hypothetical protein BX666DRAFT_2131660 [Dichotomocladium elegans]
MRTQLCDLNNELLTAIAGHLTVKDLDTFSQICHRFHAIGRSDAVWREMLYNGYGIRYKLPEHSWKEQYFRKTEDPSNNKFCPHLSCVTPRTLAPYTAPYDNVMHRPPERHNCSTCGQNHYNSGLTLYIYQGNIRIRCKECAYRFHGMRPNRHGILLRIPTLQMFCFTCNRLLGETRGDASEEHYVDQLLQSLTYDSDIGRQQLLRRRQCMYERHLYDLHADRGYLLRAIPYFYFVNRNWFRPWFLSLCDGRLAKTPIMNEDLEDEDGQLNPLARPREGHPAMFNIVTPALWRYLVDTYGLVGKEFRSDLHMGTEYADLWKSIEDWRLI